MRTLSVVVTLLVAMGLCFVGCSDQAETVAGANEIAVAETPLALAKGPLHSATGNAHFWISLNPTPPPSTLPTEPKGELLRSFTFNANLWPDGTSSGRLKEQAAPPPPGPSHYDAVVTQLLVEGNMAKIMAITEVPEVGAIHLGFVVIDNGEGDNAPRDMATWVMGAPEADMQFMYNMSPSQALAWFAYVGDIIGFPAPVELYIGNVQVQ